MEQDKNAALYPDNVNDKRNHKFRKQLLDESILPSVMYNDCILMVNWMCVWEIGEFLLWDQDQLELVELAEDEKSEAVVEVGLEDAKVDACDLRCWWLEKLCSRAEKQNKIVVVIVVRDQ